MLNFEATISQSDGRLGTFFLISLVCAGVWGSVFLLMFITDLHSCWKCPSHCHASRDGHVGLLSKNLLQSLLFILYRLQEAACANM